MRWIYFHLRVKRFFVFTAMQTLQKTSVFFRSYDNKCTATFLRFTLYFSRAETQEGYENASANVDRIKWRNRNQVSLTPRRNKHRWSSSISTVIRPHRYIRSIRCGLLLQMCVACDCVLVTTVSPAKTAEPTEMPFGVWTRVGQRNHVLGGTRIPPHW